MTLDASYFPTAQADFLPVAQTAIGSKPDFILIGAGVSQELQLAQAFATLGSSIPMGTWSSLLPQDSLNQLKSAKFSIAMDALTPSPSASQDPEVVLYNKWMKDGGFGAEAGDLSLQGWLVGRTIQAAAAKAGAGGGTLNRAGILKVLRTQELTVPLLQPLSLAKAPKQTPGYSSGANPTVKVALFKDGDKKILDLIATLP
jgi:ABC-type branched-subunit amino acid transport system substrate-binding protein